jgi:hypothetical protein
MSRLEAELPSPLDALSPGKRENSQLVSHQHKVRDYYIDGWV